MNDTKIRKLTSLEYYGMESLFQKIIDAYEDYRGIPKKAWTFSEEISRRTEIGIEVFDGPFNFYCIQKFAVKNFFIMEDICVMAGFDTTNKTIDECFESSPEILIDVTEFLDSKYIDIDRLIEKVSEFN